MRSPTRDFVPLADPRPVLQPDALYEGDNGRILHGKCSGASALYTGRDISGQKVRRLSKDALRAYLADVADIGITEACESCCSKERAAKKAAEGRA